MPHDLKPEGTYPSRVGRARSTFTACLAAMIALTACGPAEVPAPTAKPSATASNASAASPAVAAAPTASDPRATIAVAPVPSTLLSATAAGEAYPGPYFLGSTAAAVVLDEYADFQ